METHNSRATCAACGAFLEAREDGPQVALPCPNCGGQVQWVALNAQDNARANHWHLPIIGTADILEAGDSTIGGNAPPHTYFGVAQSMVPALRVLDESKASALAQNLVAAHVLECLLKAYLSRSGDDGPLIRSGDRHDLAALWVKAHGEGLAIDPTPPAWLAQLGKLHKSPYQLRYSTGINGVVLPNGAETTAGIESLVEVVRAGIRQPN